MKLKDLKVGQKFRFVIGGQVSPDAHKIVKKTAFGLTYTQGKRLGIVLPAEPRYTEEVELVDQTVTHTELLGAIHEFYLQDEMTEVDRATIERLYQHLKHKINLQVFTTTQTEIK